LGIDLVPFKTCTYDCIYCQLGRTTDKTLERKEYVRNEELIQELEARLSAGDPVDYISLAGSGEPTLHRSIGGLISRIKSLTATPVAVLTNGSLLWQSEVQEGLMAADLVLPSLDAGDSYLFGYVNRPHPGLSFERMVEGIARFTSRFSGEVWLEVLLLSGVTEETSEAAKIASLIDYIKPARTQLNTVCRPPVEEFAHPVSGERLQKLQGIFPGKVEIIADFERELGSGSALLEIRAEDIFALLNRRPCTVEDVARGLGMHRSEAVKHLSQLTNNGAVKTAIVSGQCYYIANPSREDPPKGKIGE